MDNSEIRIPEEIAPAVFALASRYYADYRQGFSESELVKAGSEVDIPPEFIQKAIQEIQIQQREKLDQHKHVQQKCQLLLKLVRQGENRDTNPLPYYACSTPSS